ncbi:trypco2 family protein [Streptomyces europaeiscabiei]|uniref:trypco2 family protein n=1 Tax=Streptomyces europaeiscabiei TaxID=146819 RepID=UPI0038D4D322
MGLLRREHKVSDAAKPVPLAEFVAALRTELRAAQADADPDLPIEVGPVTVEFTLLTRKEGEGKAGVRFWVVDAGVSGKVAAESTQKVTMQLAPLDPSGTRPARVRDVDRNTEQPRRRVDSRD